MEFQRPIEYYVWHGGLIHEKDAIHRSTAGTFNNKQLLPSTSFAHLNTVNHFYCRSSIDSQRNTYGNPQAQSHKYTNTEPLTTCGRLVAISFECHDERS